MERRTVLRWLCHATATACAAIVVVPGARFLIAPLLRRGSGAALVQRIARLDQLTVGEPKQFAVVGNRRDAWTSYPSEVIGRVWLVRRSDESTAPPDIQVDAYSAECPHLRCTIQLDAAQQQFVCPCHRAVFDIDGGALRGDQLDYENPSPRDMDALACRVVQDEQSEDWWVEVEHQRFQMGLTEQVALK
jgi:menaquinol-cytochrome c reductase iron-sulfur subunit